MQPKNLLVLSLIAIVLSGCGTPEERAAAHLATAQELFDEGDYLNAKLEAQNTAQIEPKNAEARYLLALIAEQDRQPRPMVQHLLVAIEVDPQMVEARVKLGTLYVFGRAYDLAEQQAALALSLAPEDPDVQVLQARLLLQQGERDQGLAALDKALTLNPLHVEALGMRALAFQKNDPDRALRMLDDAIGQLEGEDSRPLRRLKLDILDYHERTDELEQALLAMIEDAPDDDSTYQTRLARFYQNEGRIDEAEDMLRDLATETTEDASAKLDVVQFLAKVRAPEAAAAALRVFIEDDPENQQLRLALGDLYLSNDQRDEAVAVYQEVAEQNPSSEYGLAARVQLAADRVRNDDRVGAEQMLTSVLSDTSDYPRALLMRAGLRFAARLYDDAIADLRILLRKEPDNQRALLLMARSHIEAGDHILGKDAYRRLLELNPNLASATRELVTLMLEDDELDEAEAVLGRLTAKSDDNAAVGILAVELLMQQEDWQAAEVEARRLAAGSDPTGIGSMQLGQVLEGRQRYAEAAEAYARALEKNPDSIPVLQGLSRALMGQGKVDEALATLRERVAMYPDNPGLRLMLGGALGDQGQKSEALKVFESVIADEPGFSPVYAALASLYPDDADQRIAAYRRGLSALPGNLAISALLVDEYQRQGRTDSLIELYEELLSAHPDNLEATNNLAAILADHRYEDPTSMNRLVQLADRLSDTDNPLIMDTVGWAYYRGGANDRAVRYLERAVAANAQFPVINYHLGMAYLAAGNRFGARQELEKAVNSGRGEFDGIDEARAALAKLEGS